MRGEHSRVMWNKFHLMGSGTLCELCVIKNTQIYSFAKTIVSDNKSVIVLI